MAIKQVSTNQFPLKKDDLPGVILNIDNGDLQALEKIKEEWGFISEFDALRFALAAMVQAEDHILYVKKGKTKIGLTPGEELLKKDK